MKYVKQFLIILVISFIGEILKYLLPLPIPASIYGMVLLFTGLMTGLIKLEAVRETGKFLIEIMPVMFIPAGVALSLISYMMGTLLKKKLKLGLFNPLLISIVISIIVLWIGKIDYETYHESAKYLSWLLTPATVCLAIPLYEQWELLKQNYKAVFLDF